MTTVTPPGRARLIATAPADSPAPAGHTRVYALDVLRGLAAAVIAADHAWPATASPDPLMKALRSTTLAEPAVTLFFVLSGYVVAGPWLRALRDGVALPPARPFLLRRAARLLPAYWICFVVAVAIGIPGATVQHWWQWPVHLLLLQNLFPDGAYVAILAVAWTLGIEWLFSLALPAVANAARRLHGPAPVGTRRIVTWSVLVWVAGTLLTLVGDLAHPSASDPFGWAGPLRFCLQDFMGMFAIGAMLAVLDVKRSLLGARDALLLAGAVAIPGLVAGLGHPVAVSELRYAFYGPAAGLLIWGVLLSGKLNSGNGFLHFLGTISYGLYLTHTLLIFWLRKHDLDPGHLLTASPLSPHGWLLTWSIWILDTAVTLGFGILAGTVSWFAVERPLIRAARRLTNSRTPSPAA